MILFLVDIWEGEGLYDWVSKPTGKLVDVLKDSSSRLFSPLILQELLYYYWLNNRDYCCKFSIWIHFLWLGSLWMGHLGLPLYMSVSGFSLLKTQANKMMFQLSSTLKSAPIKFSTFTRSLLALQYLMSWTWEKTNNSWDLHKLLHYSCKHRGKISSSNSNTWSKE